MTGHQFLLLLMVIVSAAIVLVFVITIRKLSRTIDNWDSGKTGLFIITVGDFRKGPDIRRWNRFGVVDPDQVRLVKRTQAVLLVKVFITALVIFTIAASIGNSLHLRLD